MGNSPEIRLKLRNCSISPPDILLEDLLFKKSYFKLHSDPYSRCLDPEKARRIMHEP